MTDTPPPDEPRAPESEPPAGPPRHVWQPPPEPPAPGDTGVHPQPQPAPAPLFEPGDTGVHPQPPAPAPPVGAGDTGVHRLPAAHQAWAAPAPTAPPPHAPHHLPPHDRYAIGASPLVGEMGTQVAAGEAAAEETGESGGRGERAEGFKVVVAVIIALVSILGAVVAFRGSLTEQRAARLDTDGIQEVSRREQIVTDLMATVDQDKRRLLSYQEHVRAAEILDNLAATTVGDVNLADLFLAEAAAQRVLATTDQQFFRAQVPQETSKAPDQPLAYDADAALKRLESDNTQLRQLDPDATLAAADDAHHKATKLTLLVTIFIAALLFLTLAQFTRPAIRRLFAGAGVLTALAGTALWLVVERAAS